MNAPASSSNAAKELPGEPRTHDKRTNTDSAPVQTVRVAKRHELGDEELKEIVKKVGRPWYHRRKVIPRWKIKALRDAGFSLRQVGRVYDVGPTTIKRRLRGE